MLTLTSKQYVIGETIVVGAALAVLVYKLSQNKKAESEPVVPLVAPFNGGQMMAIDQMPSYTRALAADVINGGVAQYGCTWDPVSLENDEPLLVNLEQQPEWQAWGVRENEYIGRWPVRKDYHSAAHSIEPIRRYLESYPGLGRDYWHRVLTNIQ